MNSYLKLMPLILAFMMCGLTAAWAGANTNAPYCEHDPYCWVPNDDPSMWYGSDCCRHKEKPPQPHPDPDDLCWGYNWDDCKWERRTPDCKAYEDMIHKIDIIISRIVLIELPSARRKEHIASVWCDCENGSSFSCNLAKFEQYPKPSDPCNERDIQRGIILIWKSQLDTAEKEREDADKLLKDCLKCII